MHARLAAVVSVLLVLVVAQSATGTRHQVPDFLVFVRAGDLFRMAIDGSETVRLTATKAAESSPAVSPDGLRIAFTRGSDELWITNAQGVEQRMLVSARPPSVSYATTEGPSWAPDGNSIYFGRAAQGPNEICGSIYRVRADGRGLRRITRGVRLDSSPAVAPDGRRIAFTTGDCEPGSGCCSVGVVNPAGRPTRDLSRLPGQYSYDDVAWAPDGLQVALEVRNSEGDPLGIFVARSDGSGLKRLTPRGLFGEDPAWSPDGESVAFAAWTSKRTYDLYVIRKDGTALRAVTRTTAREFSPAWLRRS
jgi:TolB protein